MKDCDPTEQSSRQDVLEELYIADGRQDRSHPRHATYTGLFRAAQQQQEAAQ